jgi:hypothetical protein
LQQYTTVVHAAHSLNCAGCTSRAPHSGAAHARSALRVAAAQRHLRLPGCSHPSRGAPPRRAP